MKKSLYVFMLVLALSACAQLGLTQPQSLDQRMAYAQGTITSLRVSAATALTAGTIKKADAEEVQALADNASALLTSARTLESTDLATATGKFNLAQGILNQLQAYVTARGTK